jgi:mannose-6-phosphate isomerase class I
MNTFYRLRNQIKHYAWGSPEWIPQLLGLANDNGEPWAELWMGSHPASPSMVNVDGNAAAFGGEISLGALIAQNPEYHLGTQGASGLQSKSGIISVPLEPITKKAVSEIYANIKQRRNQQTGQTAEFVKNALDKIMGHKGFDKRIIPVLAEAFENAVFMYDEPVNTAYKTHTNFTGYSHYAAKIQIDTETVFVRFTLQNLKTKPGKPQRSEFHSVHLSHKIKNNAPGLRVNSAIITTATWSASGTTDLKLQHWLNSVKYRAAKKFSALPFLFKLLAAGQPLSIQAHPNLAQAREGFARENKAGIALDAPNRNYKDANHKPEIICALTPFTGMCGFREPAEIRSLLEAFLAGADKLLHEGFAPLFAALGAANTGTALRDFLTALFAMPHETRETLTAYIRPKTVSAVSDAGGGLSPLLWRLMRSFAELYPNDPALIAPLYLNVFHLEPGEAVFLRAGILHAYIHGLGVELMANSDNVLRGGLTPKHVDVPELMKVLEFAPMQPEIIQPPPSVSNQITILKNSPNLVLNGNAYQGKYEITGDYRKNKESVKKYLENLDLSKSLNEYISGKVALSARCIKEITNTGMTNPVYLKTLAYIPDFIEKAVFICREYKRRPTAHYKKYNQLVLGIELEGKARTVRIVIGEDNGNWYYKHFISEIEKGALIDAVQRTKPGHPGNSLPDTITDTTLLEILQAHSHFFRYPAASGLSNKSGGDFSLSVLRGTGSETPFAIAGPAICIVTEGELVIKSGQNKTIFKRGESVFISAGGAARNSGEKPPLFCGTYTLYAASLPQREGNSRTP